METPSQRFCADCGAMTQSSDATAKPLRFCESCGKAQFSAVQASQTTQIQSQSAGTAGNKAVENTQEQGLASWLVPSFVGKLSAAFALALTVGAISYFTARSSVEKPIEKPQNAQLGTPNGQSQNPEQYSSNTGVVSPETQKALTALQDSLAAQPNDKGILLRLANAWYDAGSAYQGQNAVFLARQSFAQAEKLYARFLNEFEPKNVSARIDYAYTMLSQGRADDAIVETKKALEIEPNHAIAFYNLGVIYNRKGDVAESKKYFSAAIKAAPDSEVARGAASILQSLEKASPESGS